MKTQGVGSYKMDVVSWKCFCHCQLKSSDWERLEVACDTGLTLSISRTESVNSQMWHLNTS